VASELDFRHVTVDTGDGAALVGVMIDEMRELYEVAAARRQG
jgi:hypothetical protein